MTNKMKRMKKETYLSSKTVVHGTYSNEALLAQAYQEPQRITTRPTNNEIPSWSISLIHLHSLQMTPSFGRTFHISIIQLALLWY